MEFSGFLRDAKVFLTTVFYLVSQTNLKILLDVWEFLNAARSRLFQVIQYPQNS